MTTESPDMKRVLAAATSNRGFMAGFHNDHTISSVVYPTVEAVKLGTFVDLADIPPLDADHYLFQSKLGQRLLPHFNRFLRTFGRQFITLMFRKQILLNHQVQKMSQALLILEAQLRVAEQKIRNLETSSANKASIKN